MELCDFCCKWVNEHRGKTSQEVIDDYPAMMRRVLMDECFLSKDAADAFIKDACFGNWDRLHETRIEKSLNERDYAYELLDDVFYCSDRWSWDRVLRVQWLYQRMVYRLKFRS